MARDQSPSPASEESRCTLATRLGEQLQQILSVAILFQRLGKPLELRCVDEALAEGDLLDAGNAKPLSILDGADEFTGREE